LKGGGDMEFIRSCLLRDHTSATETIELDLPTNPISHLVISISGLQMTDEATLAEILAFLNSVVVSEMGKTIVSLQSEDLFGVNTYLYRARPILTGNITTDNGPRTLGLIVPFGRRTFDPNECYPARRKGELTLYADMTALGTSIDNGLVNIDCVQLPGASPTHYLRTRMMTVAAPGGTGDYEFNLPMGSEIVAMQLRMTTFPAATSQVYGVEKVAVQVDEQEYGYVSAPVENLLADGIFRGGGTPTSMLLQQQILPLNTVWIDYDPRGDGEFLLDLKDKASAKLILEMGVNEATYLTVLERVAATSA